MRALALAEAGNAIDVTSSKISDCDDATSYLLASSTAAAQERDLWEMALEGIRRDAVTIYLFVPHLNPPRYTVREDPDVDILACTGAILREVLSHDVCLERVTPFRLLAAAVANDAPHPIRVRQLGTGAPRQNGLTPSAGVSVIVPHFGEVKHLRRATRVALSMLQRDADEVLVGLDYDPSFDPPDIDLTRCRLFRVESQRVGPYPIRNHLAQQARRPVLVFHDSDDISIGARFASIGRSLAKGDLDLIGSHELRLDLISRRLIPVRYPLDVNAALNKGPFHALLHPTSAITAEAFGALGGFSEDYFHSLDTEFLLRAHLLGARIANMDEFLYLRITRSESLTTSVRTGYDSHARVSLRESWFRDFDRVAAGRTKIAETSLALRRRATTTIREWIA